MVTSVLVSDSVLLWLPELLREGFGRAEDDILCKCGEMYGWVWCNV